MHNRPARMSAHQRIQRLASIGAVALLGAFGVACSTSTSASSDTTTATTVAVDTTDATGTTVPDTSGADTTLASEPGELTVEALEALLPSAADIGDDYTEVSADGEDDDGDDSGLESAIDDACPGFASLSDDEPSGDKAARKFEAEDGRTIQTEINPSIRDSWVTDADSMADAIDLINDCGAIEVTVDAFDYTIELAAEGDDRYGDFGATITMDVTVEHPQLAEPASMMLHVRMFALDEVGVSLTAQSGFGEGYEPIAADVDVIEALAPQLDVALADLLA